MEPFIWMKEVVCVQLGNLVTGGGVALGAILYLLICLHRKQDHIKELSAPKMYHKE